MNDTLIAAIINARVAEASVKLEAMRAQNLYRLARGENPEYNGEEFSAIIEECDIHYNAVYTLIHSERD